ncbi:hypothetical protein [Mycobacterium sp. 94-17]|uniref:hypothetical protein n=1 Tax=Mycobacterium sp. 94-17 TaxID=2986147 RepID=UPI002D1F367A|nr:hypothetical protein [Mycobacterium sp. 94-17]MEB4210972.1 hypothetical protein [Mycobacterium sp. 94-17]
MSDDPELVMHRLLHAAVNNTEELAIFLERIGCPPNSLRGRVMAELVYTVGGWIQDEDRRGSWDQPDDDPLSCTCERPVPAEVKALRILFGLVAVGVSDHGATLNDALVDAARCPACNLDVHVAAARFQKNLLDRMHPSWQPDDKLGALEEHYLSMLDEVER